MNLKLPSVLTFAAGLAWIGLPAFATAGTTVECVSHNYQYNECYAPLDSPQLVYQSSQAACIINRTWGYNPATSRIWVSQGCSGVFADPGGYHHGEAGTYDSGARSYDSLGHDVGELVAGAALGAIIESATHSDHDHKRHTTTNNYYHTGNAGPGYTGCHGIGCEVDMPHSQHQQVVDDRPQYDSQGNPNFDEHGNYIGCHGVGCEVDDPDSYSYDSDDPLEPGQTEFSGARDSDTYGMDDPPEPGQTTFSDDSSYYGSDDDYGDDAYGNDSYDDSYNDGSYDDDSYEDGSYDDSSYDDDSYDDDSYDDDSYDDSYDDDSYDDSYDD